MEIRFKYEPPKETALPGVIYLPSCPIVDLEPFEPCQLFDNLYFVGTKFVGVLIVKTSEGLVLIDSLENEANVKKILLPGMEKLGLDPKDIKTIIITHGHFDHVGGGKFLQDSYGCKVVMSTIDSEYMYVSELPDQFKPIYRPLARKVRL
jgi:metallo-beta-lactamase class B